MNRALPLLLVLLTAVPQAALAGEWFRCRYDGETRATCCCGEGEHEEYGAASAEMRSASCCDVLRNEPAAMSARAELRGDLRVVTAAAQAALAPASIDAVGAATARSWAPAAQLVVPPGPSQPLYLSHSSLLL